MRTNAGPDETTTKVPPAKRQFSIKLFRWTGLALHRIYRAANLAHEAFWLGWFTPDDLCAATGDFYSFAPSYRKPEQVFHGFYGWERDVVERYFRPGSRVLVAGAGAGREMVALAEAGFVPEGFDCCVEMVEAGKELLRSRNVPARVVLAEPSRVPHGLGIYDGLVVGWGAYHHIVGKSQRVRFLKEMRSCARAGAPILLSFFTHWDSRRYEAWLTRLANCIRGLRHPRREKVEVGDHLNVCFTHRFDEAEIADELRTAGFRLDYYSEEEYGYAVGLAE
jgi:hypothetical protein